MPKPIPNDLPRTHLWVEKIPGDLIEAVSVINSWGWAHLLISLRDYYPDYAYTVAIFRLPPAVYEITVREAEEQSDWTDPLKALQGECRQRDREIRRLRRQLEDYEAKASNEK